MTRLLQLPVLAVLRLPDLIAADSATAFSVARWVTTPSYMAFRAPMANFAACDFLHFPPLRADCFSSLESWNTDPTALFADETDETRLKGPKGLNCEVMALSHHTEYLLKDDLLGLQTGTTSSFARWRSPAFLLMLTVLTVLTVLRIGPLWLWQKPKYPEFQKRVVNDIRNILKYQHFGTFSKSFRN